MSEISLPSSPALMALLPAGQRGAVVGVNGRTGVTSLTLAFLVESLEQGRWAAIVAWPEFGAETAAELGVQLDHLALIPSPGPKWLDVVATLLDSVDVVVLRASGRISALTARRLAARTRERGCVLLVILVGRTQWPESFDVQFMATHASWIGLGHGFGTLRQRLLDVEVGGRRVPNKRRTRLLLPAPDGGTAPAPTTAATSLESDDGDVAITA